MDGVQGPAGTGDGPIGETETWESPEDSQVPTVFQGHPEQLG